MCTRFSASESLRFECVNKRKKKTLQSEVFHCLFAIFSNNSRVHRFTFTVIESQLDLLHWKRKKDTYIFHASSYNFHSSKKKNLLLRKYENVFN